LRDWARRGFNRLQRCDRLAVAREDDLLALIGAADEISQLGFGVGDGDVHGFTPPFET
jgi:hypothetical protein